MPRVNLSEEEHQVVLKLREEKRFFKAGYLTAVKELEDFLKDPATFHEVAAKLTEMLNGPN